MDVAYLITPFFAWFVTGITKFAINSIKTGKPAVSLIGYGGMPSNHSAIVSSMVAFTALAEGIDSAAFGVAITLAFIVILDANSLRKQIEAQAKAINQLVEASSIAAPALRERIGHSKLEILAGIISGSIAAALVYWCLN